MFRRFMMAAIVAGIATLAGPSRSEAALTLRLSDGVNPTVTVVDGDNDGVVVFNGAIGTWTINVTTGISKPNLGPATMDLNSVNVTNSSGGTLTIDLSDDGFVGPHSGHVLGVGGTTSGSVSFMAAGGNSNTLFDLSNASSVLNFNSSPYAGTALLPSGGNDPYSLTIRAVITHTGAGATSFNAELEPVPAPAGLILAATALPFVGLLRRRLRRQETTTAA
jgi:hypothetical protein